MYAGYSLTRPPISTITTTTTTTTAARLFPINYDSVDDELFR